MAGTQGLRQKSKIRGVAEQPCCRVAAEQHAYNPEPRHQGYGEDRFAIQAIQISAPPQFPPGRTA